MNTAVNEAQLTGAMIGLGEQAWWQLTHAWQNCDSVVLAGGHDRSAEAAARFLTRESVSAIPMFASIDELVATVRPDVISIATPPAAHLDNVLAIADAAGRHGLPPIGLYIEKPSEISLRRHDKLMAAAAEIGAVVTFGYDRLHSLDVEWARSVIASGVLGEVQHVDVAFERTGGAPLRGAFLSAAISGGGPGYDLLPHLLAIVRYVLNSPLAKVSAHTSDAILEAGGTLGQHDFSSATVEDTIRGRGKVRGLRATVGFSAAWDLPIDRDVWRFVVQGTRGALELALERVSDTDERLYASALVAPSEQYAHLPRTDGGYVRLKPEGKGRTLQGCRAALLGDLVAAVEQRRAGLPGRVRVTPGIARDVLAAVVGAYASAARDGAWVGVDA